METRLFDPAAPPEWLHAAYWRDLPHYSHIDSPTGAHCARLAHAADLAANAARAAAIDEICDVGAGDGALLQLLPQPLRSNSFGWDASVHNAGYAQLARGVAVAAADVVSGLERDRLALAPVVVCTEVLEHLENPHAFVRALTTADQGRVRYVVASSPAHETPEEHEPNHAWCWDEDGYHELFMNAGYRSHTFIRVEWSQLWLFEVIR